MIYLKQDHKHLFTTHDHNHNHHTAATSESKREKHMSKHKAKATSKRYKHQTQLQRHTNRTETQTQYHHGHGRTLAQSVDTYLPRMQKGSDTEAGTVQLQKADIDVAGASPARGELGKIRVSQS